MEVAFKTVKISLFVSAQPDVAGAEAGGVFGSTVIGMELGVLTDKEAEADRSENRGGGEEGATFHPLFSPIESVSLPAN